MKNPGRIKMLRNDKRRISEVTFWNKMEYKVECLKKFTKQPVKSF